MNTLQKLGLIKQCFENRQNSLEILLLPIQIIIFDQRKNPG